MGLVTQGWELSVTIADNGANTTTLQFKLRSADAAAAAIDSAAVIAALILVTDGTISDYYVKEHFAETVFTYPGAGVENENKASLTVLLAGAGNKKANIKIPAPVIGIFTASSGGGANVVDMSDVDLVSYMDLFKSGAECYISDGEDLVSGVSGKRISAKSNYG